MRKKIFNPWIIGVISLRIASAIYILFNPLWGFVAYCLLDWVDSQALLYFARIPRVEYEIFDKYLDWVGYSTMLFVSSGSRFFLLLLLFFVFRLIGQALFVLMKNENVFLFFPNFFEHLFFWFVVLSAPDLGKYWAWFIFIIILAPLREILLHLLWPTLLRKYRFKNGMWERVFSRMK